VNDIPNERPVIGFQILLRLVLLLVPTVRNQIEMISQWQLVLPEKGKAMATNNAHLLKTEAGTKVAPVL
jgi:hypothetical protein